jgi:fatty acid desaturase
MSLFLAFYIKNTDKRQGALPEDRLDAKIEDGDSEIGYFAPWSWWPFFLGLFAAMAFSALAVGWWLFFIAFPLALVALIGFVFERSRGQNAH